MTTDQRLDRIERILILYFNAGRRQRKGVREADEKINILINAQIKNEDGFRQLKERLDQTDRQMQETDRRMRETERKWNEKWNETVRELHEVAALFRKTDERINSLDEAQNRTDRRLNELSDRS